MGAVAVAAVVPATAAALARVILWSRCVAPGGAVSLDGHMQGGGGAVISKTNKALVMGIWSKFSNSSAGPQTQGGCADTVERVAKFMREQNF